MTQVGGGGGAQCMVFPVLHVLYYIIIGLYYIISYSMIAPRYTAQPRISPSKFKLEEMANNGEVVYLSDCVPRPHTM